MMKYTAEVHNAARKDYQSVDIFIRSGGRPSYWVEAETKEEAIQLFLEGLQRYNAKGKNGDYRLQSVTDLGGIKKSYKFVAGFSF